MGGNLRTLLLTLTGESLLFVLSDYDSWLVLQATPDRVTAETGGKAHMGLMPPPPQV